MQLDLCHPGVGDHDVVPIVTVVDFGAGACDLWGPCTTQVQRVCPQAALV